MGSGIWGLRTSRQGAVVIRLPAENELTMGERGNRCSTKKCAWEELTPKGRFDV